MKTKTSVKAGEFPLSSNHNETLLSEAGNDVDQNAWVEVDETELEIIIDALRVRSGLQAGLQPCI